MRLVPANSVAVVVRSGILERTVPVAVVPYETTLNQDMKAVAPREGVDARWVAWGLRAFERELLRDTRKAGTTVASIEMPRFYDFEIPVPAIGEQRCIIDMLEEHLSRLDAAKETLALNRAKLSGLRERSMVDALTQYHAQPRWAPDLADAGTADGTLPSLPHGWTWSRLGEVADVVGGVTKDAKKQGDPQFVEVPYLRVANVQRGRLDLDQVTRIKVAPAKAAALRLYPGDVLLNEGGDRDKLARGWVWEGQIDDCIHQNHVFRARIRDSRVDPYFLSWTANTLGAKWAERNGKQSVNLASISLSTIRRMPVIVPKAGEAARVAAHIEEVSSAYDRLDAAIVSATTRYDVLRRSLLAAAFSGLLTGHASDLERVDEMAFS